MGHKQSVVLFALVAASALSGCAKTPRDKLQGRWLGESLANAGTSAGDQAKAEGWVKGAAMEFAGPKVTITIPAEAPRAGTFKVAKAEGELVTVNFKREEGQVDEAEFKFIGENKLAWEIGEGREVIFTKAVAN